MTAVAAALDWHHDHAGEAQGDRLRCSAMVATDKLFAGSIPEIYDRLLVPLIFESYALDLAQRVVKAEPQDVLETAAGSGVVTRTMASRLPANARIVAT